MEIPSGKRRMMPLTRSDYVNTPFVPGLWAHPCETWGEYLIKEKARIEKGSGRIAEIRMSVYGLVALWVDRVAG